MTNIETIDVMLSIAGEQYFQGVDPDQTRLMTPGTMTMQGEKVTLTYEETELTGMEGTTTTFEVDGDVITLTRAGAVNSQMVFQEGVQHTSLYETPFGDLAVDIQTSHLRYRLNQHGGTMDIQYSIAVDHTVTGRNRFEIKVKRK
ncbi:DUF1934 domain-containing protein [Bengtsoniella intestinalis]|uniref:DUF1934 domain-containing protein n=1 Tax=Bengtsoniella intestinalis TaxID=3073143 RepID=UPI00391FAC46